MKGCIIKNDEISIKDICNIIGDVDNYNWLITNIECYPSDEEIVKILNNEYCWIEGRSLLDLLAKEEFQWIWVNITVRRSRQSGVARATCPD